MKYSRKVLYILSHSNFTLHKFEWPYVYLKITKEYIINIQ